MSDSPKPFGLVRDGRAMALSAVSLCHAASPWSISKGWPPLSIRFDRDGKSGQERHAAGVSACPKSHGQLAERARVSEMKTENLDFRIKVGGQFVPVSKDDFEALVKGMESFRKLRANRARAVRRAIAEGDVFAATDAIDEYLGFNLVRKVSRRLAEMPR